MPRLAPRRDGKAEAREVIKPIVLAVPMAVRPMLDLIDPFRLHGNPPIPLLLQIRIFFGDNRACRCVPANRIGVNFALTDRARSIAILHAFCDLWPVLPISPA